MSASNLTRAWDLSSGRPHRIPRRHTGKEIVIAQIADPFPAVDAGTPQAPVVSGSFSVVVQHLDPRFVLVPTLFFRRSAWFNRRLAEGKIVGAEIVDDFDGKNYTRKECSAVLVRKDTAAGELHEIGTSQSDTWLNGGTVPDGTEIRSATGGIRIKVDFEIESVQLNTDGYGAYSVSRPSAAQREAVYSDVAAGSGSLDLTVVFTDASTITATISAADLGQDINYITSLFAPAWAAQTGKQISSVRYTVTEEFALAGGTLLTLLLYLEVSHGGFFAVVDCMRPVGVEQTYAVAGIRVPNYEHPIQANIHSLVGTIGSGVPLTFDKLPTYDLVMGLEAVPEIRLGCDGFADEVMEALEITIDPPKTLIAGSQWTYAE